jgi:hypothetical protein
MAAQIQPVIGQHVSYYSGIGADPADAVIVAIFDRHRGVRGCFCDIRIESGRVLEFVNYGKMPSGAYCT